MSLTRIPTDSGRRFRNRPRSCVKHSSAEGKLQHDDSAHAIELGSHTKPSGSAMAPRCYHRERRNRPEGRFPE